MIEYVNPNIAVKIWEQDFRSLVSSCWSSQFLSPDTAVFGIELPLRSSSVLDGMCKKRVDCKNRETNLEITNLEITRSWVELGMLVEVNRKGRENSERGGKRDMGAQAKDEIKCEGYKTESTGIKVEEVLNSMPRAPSVDDLFAPLCGLNVRAGGEAHQSSSTSVAQPSSATSSPQVRLTCSEGADAALPRGSGEAHQSSSTSAAQPSPATQASQARHTGREGADAALPPSQSTSDDDQQNGTGLDERKQKRMLSNRESARRSRLRKQQHLDELRAQVANLRAENTDMMARYGIASQRYSQVTGENVVLRAHAADLSRKLHQLHHELAIQHPNALRPLGIQSVDQFAGDLSPFLQP